jgi:hypothetical protein
MAKPAQIVNLRRLLVDQNWRRNRRFEFVVRIGR